MPGEPALSVWPTAQRTATSQRAGRYVSGTAAHAGKMLPAIARAAVLAYGSRGDVVLDPIGGLATTLVESVHLEREAVGVEYEPDSGAIAEENLALAASQGATA